jgi:hypothetical protein
MRYIVRVEGVDIDIKTVNFVLNRRVLLAVLVVSGLSVLISISTPSTLTIYLII